MNEPAKIPTSADIRLEMRKNAEHLAACEAARTLKAGEVSTLERQLEDLLAKAEAAKNQPGDPLAAADEWGRYDRAAVIVRPRLEAARAELKQLPTGYSPEYIRYAVTRALEPPQNKLFHFCGISGHVF